MGIFSTRNHDGAAGHGEPVDTIPARVNRGMSRQAERHLCDSRSELYTAPGLSSGHDFDPHRAKEN